MTSEGREMFMSSIKTSDEECRKRYVYVRYKDER